MSHYIKLVNFEINRFIKLYIGLLVFTVISQFVGIFIVKSYYMKLATEANYGSSTKATKEFIESNGLLSFYQVTDGLWFRVPIAICVTSMLLYIFLIWYWDYLGKNTFIYRLFMLPTSRMTVYYAKASTILLMILGLIAFQLILLPIEINVFHSILPSELLDKVTVIDVITNSPYLSAILPNSFIDFLLLNILGLAFIFILFTIILLERSYQWKGIFFGVIYIIVLLGLLISPLLFNAFILDRVYHTSLYANEMLYTMLGLIGIITTMSILFSRYLLKNKVSV